MRHSAPTFPSLQRILSRNIHKPNFGNNENQRLSAFLPETIGTQSNTEEYLAQHIIGQHSVQKSKFKGLSANLYAINKPYGLSTYGYVRLKKPQRFRRGVEWAAETSEEEELREQENTDTPSIAKALPFLAALLQESRLYVVKALPRYVSGPILLANSESLAQWTNFRLGNASNVCGSSMTMATIVVGTMAEKEGSEKVHAFLEQTGKVAYPTLLNRAGSTKELKKLLVTHDKLDYRVLGEASGCSFLEMNLNKFHRHIPRLFLSDHLCPILGDTLYQQRFATVLGEKIQLPPEKGSDQNQYIPPELLKALEITVRDYHQLPICMHISILRIPGLLKGPEKTLEIGVPLPKYFQNVISAIGLGYCLDDE